MRNSVFTVLQYSLNKNILIYGYFFSSLVMTKLQIELNISFKTQKFQFLMYKLIKVLKNFFFLRFNFFIDITCVDLLNFFINNSSTEFDDRLIDEYTRFKIIYIFKSLKLFKSVLINFKLYFENNFIYSLNNLFIGSVWAEREVYDLFGVFFINNFDLRRLLTDYGFKGFPLRKDFPLIGYEEINYNIEFESIIYDSIFLAQSYRNFSSFNFWWLNK